MFDRIANGRTDLVFDYVAQGHAANSTDKNGVALIKHCSYYGDVSAIRFLIANGESLQSLGENLGLGAAAFHGHWRLCEFLIENGAEVNHASANTGETPLHAALSSDSSRIAHNLVIKVLLAHGADPNRKTKPSAETGSFMRDCGTKADAPLHRAAAFGTEDTIQMLLDASAAIDAKDMNGDSLLTWAIRVSPSHRWRRPSMAPSGRALGERQRQCPDLDLLAELRFSLLVRRFSPSLGALDQTNDQKHYNADTSHHSECSDFAACPSASQPPARTRCDQIIPVWIIGSILSPRRVGECPDEVSHFGDRAMTALSWQGQVTRPAEARDSDAVPRRDRRAALDRIDPDPNAIVIELESPRLVNGLDNAPHDHSSGVSVFRDPLGLGFRSKAEADQRRKDQLTPTALDSPRSCYLSARQRIGTDPTHVITPRLALSDRGPDRHAVVDVNDRLVSVAAHAEHGAIS